jgi:eukaryotic-like serine/threonine-protein kinase
VDTTVADPLVGRVLEGRYAVQSRIARGGMATVYLAVDQRLDREVALKVMHPDLAQDEEFLRRFIREARSAARLSHPGVVAVYDQGQDDGSWFLVMEYVPGRTLRDLINERGRLTPREALSLLDPVLDALAAAHWTGIIHRDIKPENVLLADDGRVKVADFGLARAITTNTTNNDSKVLLGTVAYLAPEQVERGVADARSDVYAIGIVLFEMLTGRKPFLGDTPIQVAYQHVHSNVPAPSSLVPGLAPALDALVVRAAARDADARPADAGELLVEARRTRAALTPDELDGVAPGGEPTVLVPAVGSFVVPGGPAVPLMSAPAAMPAQSAPTGVLDLTSAPPPGQPPRQRQDGQRRPGRTAAIVVLVLALVLGLAGWYVGAGPGSKIPTPDVVAKTQAAAVQMLGAKGLHARVVQVFSETAPVGRVVATDPAPGKSVSKHGTVVLDISKGQERYSVPTLAGLATSKAENALASTHLTLGEVTQQYSDTVKNGYVISSDPVSGTLLAPAKPVDLVVSQGPAPVQLDDWTGKAATQATQALEGAGLTVKTTQKYNETVPLGDVISQSPGSGTVHRGDTINLVVSKGPPLVLVPDVTGQSVDDARQELRAAGFEVKVTHVFPWIAGGNVIAQSPNGNTNAPKGSTITIAIR